MPVKRKKRYARFTDAELQYIYLECDVDTDPAMFRRIERKCRKQIKRYRDFDRERKIQNAKIQRTNQSTADTGGSATPH